MTKAKPKKKGRPSRYTPELAAKICRRLAKGETLRAICRDPAMPDKATVLRWLADKKRPNSATSTRTRGRCRPTRCSTKPLRSPTMPRATGQWTRTGRRPFHRSHLGGDMSGLTMAASGAVRRIKNREV